MRLTLVLMLLLASQQQTSDELLQQIRALIDAHFALPAPIPPPIVRVQVGEDAQAVLESMLDTGGVIELGDGDHAWDVRRPYREVQPLITIRGIGAATIRGVYAPTAGNLAFEDLRIAGNPQRSAHIQLGGDRHAMSTEAQVPAYFFFRRVVADGAGAVRRGITLNARHVFIEDSEFLNYYVPGVDSQAAGGWNGTQYIVIRRTILEGGSQGIIFGGSDAASEAMFPQDILIEDSILRKHREWMSQADIKCAFELKNALRVIFRRNEIDGVWADPTGWPQGTGIKINTANQEGTNPTARVEDVLIEGNTIRNVGQYVNIVGSNAGPFTSAQSWGIRILRNRFLAMHLEGDGRAVVVNDGAQDVLIDHNTFEDNRHSFLELVGLASQVTFSNNVARHGVYGVRNTNGSTLAATHNALEVRSGTQPQWVPPAGSGNQYYPTPINAADLSSHVTSDGLPVGA